MDADLRSRETRFRAYIAETDLVSVYFCNAGDFGDHASLGLDLAGLRQRVLKLKAGEPAVYLSAGANALHDLLADVAALGKVQGLVLFGFLRQIFFPDILAVTRDSMHDTPLLHGADARGPRRRFL